MSVGIDSSWKIQSDDEFDTLARECATKFADRLSNCKETKYKSKSMVLQSCTKIPKAEIIVSWCFIAWMTCRQSPSRITLDHPRVLIQLSTSRMKAL